MGETIKKFELPTEKVKIKFIRKKQGIAAEVADNHIISGGMLEGSYKKFPVPMMRSGALKNVLTKEEKEWFEENVFQGQNLSMYNNDFWGKQYVTLEKLDTILDLSIPEEYLKYKILLGWDTVVASSLEVHKNFPSLAHIFYLERDGETHRMESKSLNITKAAWKNFDKIEDNRDVLSAVIFLTSGKKVAGNAKLEYLNQECSKVVDKTPEKFNALIEDAQFETKILVANAERAGVILKVKGAYETKDGLPLTDKGQPATVDNVVTFINNPLNNEAKELLLSRLDNIKE